MKNFILLFFLAISATFMFGQTQKGNVLLGASTNINLFGYGNNTEILSLGFSSTKYGDEDDTEKTISANLFPKVGYFLANNFALGLDINLALSSQKVDNEEGKTNTTLLGVGPFARDYIPAKKVLPFLEVNSLFGTFNTSFNVNDLSQTFKTKFSSFGGGVGVAMPIGDKFCFDVLLGYTNFKLKSDELFEEETIKINSVGIKLGITVFLGKTATL